MAQHAPLLTNPQLLLLSLIFPLFFFVAFAGGLSNIATSRFDFPSGHGVPVRLRAAAGERVRRRVHRLRHRQRLRERLRARLMLAAPNRLGILAGYTLAALSRAAIVP